MYTFVYVVTEQDKVKYFCKKKITNEPRSILIIKQLNANDNKIILLNWQFNSWERPNKLRNRAKWQKCVQKNECPLLRTISEKITGFLFYLIFQLQNWQKLQKKKKAPLKLWHKKKMKEQKSILVSFHHSICLIEAISVMLLHYLFFFLAFSLSGTLNFLQLCWGQLLPQGDVRVCLCIWVSYTHISHVQHP